jgi:hypothetical protein
MLLGFALGLVGGPARADEVSRPMTATVTPPSPTTSRPFDPSSPLLFLGGAVSGLAFHEMGHVMMNLAYGNVPTLTAVKYDGSVPWFVINPRLRLVNGVYYKADGQVFAGGARGYYDINMAGFLVQNFGSDMILSAHPRLRYEHAPYAEGLFWMNVGLSIGYATASFLGIEDPHGDIYGGARDSNYPHQLIAGMVMASGVLDAFTYLFPDDDMLLWLSRSAKVMFLGMGVPID